MIGVAVTSFAWVDDAGMTGPMGHRAWAQLDATGVGDVKWRAISDRPNDRFGRMDRLSRAGVLTTDMLNLAVANGQPDDHTAVVFGTRWGCTESDAAYYHTTLRRTGPSPLLFTRTLASIPAAEVAIRHGLRGDHVCLMAGEESGLAALWEAVQLVAYGEAPRCVCLAGDTIGDDTAELLTALTGQCVKAHCRLHAVVIESAAATNPTAANPTTTPTAAKPAIDCEPASSWTSAGPCSRPIPARVQIERLNQADSKTPPCPPAHAFPKLCRMLAQCAPAPLRLVLPAPRGIRGDATLTIVRTVDSTIGAQRGMSTHDQPG